LFKKLKRRHKIEKEEEEDIKKTRTRDLRDTTFVRGV